MVNGLAGFRFEVQRTGVHTHCRVAAGGFHMLNASACGIASVSQYVVARTDWKLVA